VVEVRFRKPKDFTQIIKNVSCPKKPNSIGRLQTRSSETGQDGSKKEIVEQNETARVKNERGRTDKRGKKDDKLKNNERKPISSAEVDVKRRSENKQRSDSKPGHSSKTKTNLENERREKARVNEDRKGKEKRRDNAKVKTTNESNNKQGRPQFGYVESKENKCGVCDASYKNLDRLLHHLRSARHQVP
jgi:hypothetical protein